MSLLSSLKTKLKLGPTAPPRVAFDPTDSPLPSVLPRPSTLAEADPPHDDILAITQAAVFHHEKEAYREALYFESIGASRGDPLCMFLYGMAHRHGWGVAADEKAGFAWLQKAGEMAMRNLRTPSNPEMAQRSPASPQSSYLNPERQKNERAALRRLATEQLTMAITELGQCFLQGWGVEQNTRTALYYFGIAADLGDGDALVALGDAYYNGTGVKRDKKVAAMYYRLARKRGALKDAPGMGWIDKPKYDSPEYTKALEALEKDELEAVVLGIQDEAEPVGGRKWWH
ncbi:hypothetical protein DFJ74DRAFT_672509 [Hyaloraphidium curvatum]|nr:hypothetical protein DFJ74DRAFT_672509 [Hyaloraphidium curvatum]